MVYPPLRPILKLIALCAPSCCCCVNASVPARLTPLMFYTAWFRSAVLNTQTRLSPLPAASRDNTVGFTCIGHEHVLCRLWTNSKHQAVLSAACCQSCTASRTAVVLPASAVPRLSSRKGNPRRWQRQPARWALFTGLLEDL